MPTPGADVAAHLVAGSPLAGVTLTLGGNVFGGPIPVATGVPQGTTTVPLQAIGCIETGGANTPLLNGGGMRINEPTVTVQVRSAGDRYTPGVELARAAKSRCNAASVAGYVGWWAGEVTYLGPDESGAHHWNFVIRCMYAAS